MSVIKEKSISALGGLGSFIGRSSWRQRLLVLAPILVAALLAALALSGQIFFLGRGMEGYIGAFFHSFLLLSLFLCPLTWVSVRLLPGLKQRFPERRATDALIIGLYLPHLFVTLFMIKSQFTDVDTVIRFSGAIAAWAMFSLLLSPICMVFVFLIWTFLPKPKDNPPVETPIVSQEENKPLVQTPVAEQDSTPPESRLKRIAGFRRKG
ncbi:MAG: hypothetical protein NXI13_02990 [Proteobacteria bacterium]|nr:hypothetical protein [Pseudomonadota bacterium]